MDKEILKISEAFKAQEKMLREGGDQAGIDRQKKLNRLTVRERLHLLLDPHSYFFELGLWAGYKMYPEWDPLPAAGVVTGIGTIYDQKCMVIANDATVKAGAFFPQSVKKVLRAQTIAFECQLPIIYLVDSSGVFLPLQDEIFPDQDDFGRIFRNNAVLSSQGIPQFAAIMGNCIAGGGYLPVLCDKILMTKGSGLYLAGPSLVKAAIGQVVETEELGGAKMHAELSGTVDFLEEDDSACLMRLRALVDMLPKDSSKDESYSTLPKAFFEKDFTTHELLTLIADKNSIQEYKASYGKSLVTVFAKIGGQPVGIIANENAQTLAGNGEVEIGGVIYAESADKAARFVMDCNQDKIPLIFLQDVVGFMVGKKAEQSGIIKSGAKLVNAISNSIVPKITLIIGNSFGAGNYALCGKAYDPNFILAWPNAKLAVMGAEQAAETLFQIRLKANKDEALKMKEEIKKSYEEKVDIRYAAARGWIDAIIYPEDTRIHLINLLKWVKRRPIADKKFHTGVLQV